MNDLENRLHGLETQIRGNLSWWDVHGHLRTGFNKDVSACGFEMQARLATSCVTALLEGQLDEAIIFAKKSKDAEEMAWELHGKGI